MGYYTKGIIGLIVSILLAWGTADAAPTYHLERPANVIKVQDAVKTAKTQKPVYKCRKSSLSNAAGYSAVKGSKNSWHSSIPDGIDDVPDDKPVYKCQAMVWDADRKKMSNYSEGDE